MGKSWNLCFTFSYNPRLIVLRTFRFFLFFFVLQIMLTSWNTEYIFTVWYIMCIWYSYMDYSSVILVGLVLGSTCHMVFQDRCDISQNVRVKAESIILVLKWSRRDIWIVKKKMQSRFKMRIRFSSLITE